MVCHLCHDCERYVENSVDPYKKSWRLVIVISTIIGFIYFCLLGVVLTPWISSGQENGLTHLFVINGFMFLVCYSYYSVCTTNPGRIPSNYRPPNTTDEELEAAKNLPKKHVRNTYYLRLRWCETCQIFKPPRAHHCKCCGRCVLRMDHHCPYINNWYFILFCNSLLKCWGFVLFLLFVDIAMAYSFLLFANRLYGIIFGQEIGSIFHGFIIFVNLILIPYLIVSTGLLLVNQIALLSKNVTKIELWTKHWATSDFKELGEVYHYPYDKGWKENFKEIFGRTPLQWFLPIPPEIDGLSYPDLVTKNIENKV